MLRLNVSTSCNSAISAQDSSRASMIVRYVNGILLILLMLILLISADQQRSIALVYQQCKLRQ